MNKTTKYSFLKAACLMLSVIMLTAYVLPETLAKYTSSGNISVPLTVARWEIDVGSEEENGTLGYMSTIDLRDLVWTTIPDGVTDLPTNPNTIVPGTWGYVEIQITNNSDVDANVTISGIDDITSMDTVSGGLTFAVADSAPTSYGDIEPLPDDESFVLTQGDTKSLYICYQWLLDGYNDEDTLLAAPEEGTPKVFYFDTLTITAEQVE